MFNWEKIAPLFFEKALLILLASLLFLLLRKGCQLIVAHLFNSYHGLSAEEPRLRTLSKLSLSTLNYITLFLYIYTVLSIFGLPVASLLAGAGIVGVAVSFGAREFVTDVITGFFIITENQFNVGELITLKNLDLTGKVHTIGLRTTILENQEGSLLFVPNHNIQTVTNHARQASKLTVDLPISAQEARQALEVIQAINHDYPNVTTLGPFSKDDKLYIRSEITGALPEIKVLSYELMAAYLDKIGE